MKKTLSVSAIENGCVIDHIPEGQASKILHALKLTEGDCQLTVGMHLKSKRGGRKDIIKLEGRQFTQDELKTISIYAAGATVNEIKNFEVLKKNVLALPESVTGLLRCPNSNCISNHECVTSKFTLEQQHQHVQFHCHYCESGFSHLAF